MSTEAENDCTRNYVHRQYCLLLSSLLYLQWAMCRFLLVTASIALIICSAAFREDTGMIFEVGRGGEWGRTPQIPYKCALYIMTLSPAKHPNMKLHISDPVKGFVGFQKCYTLLKEGVRGQTSVQTASKQCTLRT